MQEKAYYFTLLIIAGCSIAVAHSILTMEGPDYPTKEEVLEAIEKGAANLTVTPVMGSQN